MSRSVSVTVFVSDLEKGYVEIDSEGTVQEVVWALMNGIHLSLKNIPDKKSRKQLTKEITKVLKKNV